VWAHERDPSSGVVPPKGPLQSSTQPIRPRHVGRRKGTPHPASSLRRDFYKVQVNPPDSTQPIRFRRRSDSSLRKQSLQLDHGPPRSAPPRATRAAPPRLRRGARQKLPSLIKEGPVRKRRGWLSAAGADFGPLKSAISRRDLYKVHPNRSGSTQPIRPRRVGP
jgi:hypothetical protein